MIKNVLAGVAVRDLEASLPFYTRVFGRKPDTRPMDGLAEWGTLQVFQDASRAGHSSATLVVEDVRAEASRLELKGEVNVAPSVDTLIFQDPDGNQLVLAQPKSADVAQ